MKDKDNKSIKDMLQPKKVKLSSSQVIIFGFMAVILMGMLLLKLPAATYHDGCATWKETFFTATSAVCVCGLILQDTATYWTPFGQGIILVLIQIGGMGVMTVALLISMLSGRRIGLMQRNTMTESVSAHSIGGIVRFTRLILIGTAIVEGTGALLLMFAFIPAFGLKGIWYGLFHSISAFCNAGFDLMGVREQFSSLCSFAADPLVVLVVCALILIGGIGFLTWEDIRTQKLHFSKYRPQTKVILVVSAILVLLPFVLYFAEYRTLPLGERILAALFQAITPRTAGFNTKDLSQLSDPSKMLMIVLMLTGGASGSTAGGIKLTTMAVLFAAMISVFRRKEDTEIAGRRLESDTVYTALAVLMMYLTLFITSACIISAVDQVPMLDCLFETASAVATVGLTLGLTPSLSTVSHLILAALMFIGRVGGLTLIFAATTEGQNRSKKPKGKISVG